MSADNGNGNNNGFGPQITQISADYGKDDSDNGNNGNDERVGTADERG